MVKVAFPPWEPCGAFSWIVPLPDHVTGSGDITWYCDGSLIDGKWSAIRCSGFGIAAFSNEGDLVAYGLGWPPSWCDTAASAEAWAQAAQMGVLEARRRLLVLPDLLLHMP